ncbi:MAG: hypothetical protein MI740_07155, partial [Halanaerobiales bacterium]|nr:hypothetical protein [Halanaerobiales bacterium]
MKENLKNLFKVGGLDYGDLRFEQNQEIEISYEGQELKEIKNSYREGGYLRIYNQGSKAVGAFSELQDASKTRD